MTPPLVRDLLARIDALLPIDRAALFDALNDVVMDETSSQDLWRELRDRHGVWDEYLEDVVVEWLRDDEDVRVSVFQRLLAGLSPSNEPTQAGGHDARA